MMDDGGDDDDDDDMMLAAILSGEPFADLPRCFRKKKNICKTAYLEMIAQKLILSKTSS